MAVATPLRKLAKQEQPQKKKNSLASPCTNHKIYLCNIQNLGADCQNFNNAGIFY